MFLDIAKFTGLLKSAYKNSGLTIGYLNDGIIITSGYWVVWLREEQMPNKIKGMIVELCGLLPDHETMFYISKDSPNPQYKIDKSDWMLDMIEKYRDADKKLHITPILLLEGIDIRLFQTSTRDLVGVNEAYFRIVDPANVEYGQESMPTGPCYNHTPLSGIYWHNENCIVILLPAKIKGDNIADALKTVDFASN